MTSLIDVLLAASNIPIDDPIAEIWGRQMQGEYKIIEYTGALPVTINANGDALLDYRIYGTDGGVGVATESGEPAGYKLPMVTRSRNLLVPIATEQIIDLKPNTVYVASRYVRGRISISVYDENDTLIFSDYVSYWTSMIFGGYANQRYAKVSTTSDLVNNASIVEGDEDFVSNFTPCPSTYIPYSRTDTPVYIGENQLGDGEYVSYGEKKIYRDVGGILAPTDPPVPLPEIPTIDGTTIIDYDGTPKPSQMYVKYKGKG